MLERKHIGIFGKVNAGKSSFINALTGQQLSVVSEKAGTTTDPVRKAMEILPIGPVMLYDTAGLSDESDLGELRMEKTSEVLRKTDIGLLVIDASGLLSSQTIFTDEKKILEDLNKRSIPFLVVLNKVDLIKAGEKSQLYEIVCDNLNIKSKDIAFFSSDKYSETEIYEIRERISKLIKESQKRYLVSDLISKKDIVVMVVPIDESAPKDRIILPQQQVLRDILDSEGTAVVCQPNELKDTLDALKRQPRLVITDSQAFSEVKKIVPEDMALTSFSILMARYKGNLVWQAKGAKVIDSLDEGSKILVSEGCTHHRQCGDIGTVKLPNWIREHTGKNFEFIFTSGGEFPKNLSDYSLMIHCGGCTLPPQEMEYRISAARQAGIPITNYGMMIAYINGILKRSLRIFNETKGV